MQPSRVDLEPNIFKLLYELANLNENSKVGMIQSSLNVEDSVK